MRLLLLSLLFLLACGHNPAALPRDPTPTAPPDSRLTLTVIALDRKVTALAATTTSATGYSPTISCS